MADPTGTDVKPFIGSNDFVASRDFYVALGWQVNWDRGDIAELELAGHRFYLQRYYLKQWCDNTMLHITVDDAQAWYDHASAVISNHTFASVAGGTRVAAPQEQDYGAIVTHVWDPAGNLLHFAQYLNQP